MSAFLWALLALQLVGLAGNGVAIWLVIRKGVAAVNLAQRAEHALAEAARSNAAGLASGPIMFGPWWPLILAVAAEPEGRLQITRQAIESARILPADEVVDRYLNDRWPGLELWRSEDRADLGVIIEWRNRP